MADQSDDQPERPWHHLPDGKFRNPKGSPKRNPRARTVLRFSREMAKMQRAGVDVPEGHVLPREVAKATWDRLDQTTGDDLLCWLGHAAFLIKMNGLNILTDPYLSTYAGPSGFGPKRYVKSGIPVRDLPVIDLLIVSHNHYDHLDDATIRRLPHKAHTTVIVPLKLGKWFRERGYTKIIELDWEQSHTHQGVTVTALPVVHWSNRRGYDRNRTLWAGFKMESEKQSLFFGGDSAYGPVFEEIGARFGPFDTALLGIGAYAPREIMHASHATPEEAVRMGVDMGARRLVGMHWGTVILTAEPPFEPPERFIKSGRDQGYADDDLWVMKIGETRPLHPAAAGQNL
ncbi:MAG: MBL fold metallo-hydrolase [Alphaproteobacteria bacterium]